jgi:hypothetical protein
MKTKTKYQDTNTQINTKLQDPNTRETSSFSEPDSAEEARNRFCESSELLKRFARIHLGAALPQPLKAEEATTKDTKITKCLDEERMGIHNATLFPLRELRAFVVIKIFASMHRK